MIKLRYSAVDGFSKLKTFKSLKGARKYAIEMLGKYPSFGSYYAVSDDGVGKITVIDGVGLRELFGDEPKPAAPVASAMADELGVYDDEGSEAPGFDDPYANEFKVGKVEFDPGADYDDDIPF